MIDVLGVRNECAAYIPVRDQSRMQHYTDWQIGLQPDAAGSSTAFEFPCGKQQRESRRHSHPAGARTNRLIAIIENRVAETSTGAGKTARVRSHEGIAELVPPIPVATNLAFVVHHTGIGAALSNKGVRFITNPH